jgi:hypothetical protein
MKQLVGYTSRDFLLYILSLAGFGALCIVAFPVVWVQLLLLSLLVFMAVVFVIRVGVSADWPSLAVFVRGVLTYPFALVREVIRGTLPFLLPWLVGYAIALPLEHVLRERWGDSFLYSTVPYYTIFLTTFALVTAFRTVALVHHLQRRAHIAAFLAASPYRTFTRGVSTTVLIVHAYVTGVLSQIGGVLPSLIFAQLTQPTYLRELVAAAIGWLIVVVCRIDTVKAFNRWFAGDHARAHTSRFWFTVFHGTHHDAIPSGLIGGAGGNGFLEGVHRSIACFWFLQGGVLFLGIFGPIGVVHDMMVHQYIPGVFPFCRNVLVARAHHALHHFFTLEPLSVGSQRALEEDVRNGYRMDNPKARWFAEVAAKHEDLDQALVDGYTASPGRWQPVWKRVLGSFNDLRRGDQHAA